MKAKLIAEVAVVAIAAGAGFVAPGQYLGEPAWTEFHALVERALAQPA